MLSILAQLRRLHDDQQDRRDQDTNDDADDAFSKDGTLAHYSGLNLFDKMDEEELVIDSPEQEPVEDEDLEDVDDNLKLGQPAAPKPVKDKDANREQVCSLSPSKACSHSPDKCAFVPDIYTYTYLCLTNYSS